MSVSINLEIPFCICANGILSRLHHVRTLQYYVNAPVQQITEAFKDVSFKDLNNLVVINRTIHVGNLQFLLTSMGGPGAPHLSGSGPKGISQS